MARPSQPLLTRESVVAAALRIIDAEGLTACSTPRLAREFGVRAPSLYHHFADRADIMAEVARLVVRQTPFPKERDPEKWMDWFVEQAVNFRRTILKHPNVAPILLEFLPRDQLSVLYDSAAELMTEAGVPVEVHALVLDGLETLTVGAALITATKGAENRSTPFPALNPATDTNLARAVAANPWNTTEELFAEVVRAMLRGAMVQAGVSVV
ncbi:TetR family transcriptional regulator [Sporichthya polymorpha]|uniref:TetR family transcriptional regulator n=1 Tax=Sporichthya polymorpha TaxID=35751 RepID=UPI00036B48A8|nr:TetR family transcriptional regulator [Sporichthya polymorpha]